MFSDLPTYQDRALRLEPTSVSIPSHWRIGRVKDAGRLVYGDALPADVRTPGETRVMGSNGPIGIHSVPNTVGKTIIVGRKGSHGKVHLSVEPVWVMDTAYYIDHRSSRENLDWLVHVLRWLQLDQTSKDSAVPGLDRDDAHGTAIPIPRADEQAGIVKYLGHAHARIDRAIAAKRKLIALLEEQKQAIIHQAVTRGLDPNAPLKDSGIPWLGAIPAHWRIVPLKQLARFKSGAGFPVSEQGRTGNVIPFFRVSDMNAPGNEQWLHMTDSSVTPEDAHRLGAHVFPAGSIVFPKVGGALLTNKRRRLAQASCVDNNVMGAILPAHKNGEYVNLVLSRVDLGKYVNPGPVPAIGEGQVGRIRVAVPPDSEQSGILEIVETSTTSISFTQERARDEVDLLREFRTRLSSDVVTGQVDVRDIAASLPELTEDMLATTDLDTVDTEPEDAEDFAEGEDD